MSKIGHEYDLALARRSLQIHKSSRAMYLTFLAIGIILTFNNVVFFHPIVNALIAIFFGFMAWGQHLSVEEFKRAVNDNENALKKQNAKKGKLKLLSFFFSFTEDRLHILLNAKSVAKE